MQDISDTLANVFFTFLCLRVTNGITTQYSRPITTQSSGGIDQSKATQPAVFTNHGPVPRRHRPIQGHTAGSVHQSRPSSPAAPTNPGSHSRQCSPITAQFSGGIDRRFGETEITTIGDRTDRDHNDRRPHRPRSQRPETAQTEITTIGDRTDRDQNDQRLHRPRSKRSETAQTEIKTIRDRTDRDHNDRRPHRPRSKRSETAQTEITTIGDRTDRDHSDRRPHRPRSKRSETAPTEITTTGDRTDRDHNDRRLHRPRSKRPETAQTEIKTIGDRTDRDHSDRRPHRPRSQRSETAQTEIKTIRDRTDRDQNDRRPHRPRSQRSETAESPSAGGRCCILNYMASAAISGCLPLLQYRSPPLPTPFLRVYLQCISPDLSFKVKTVNNVSIIIYRNQRTYCLSRNQVLTSGSGDEKRDHCDSLQKQLHRDPLETTETFCQTGAQTNRDIQSDRCTDQQRHSVKPGGAQTERDIRCTVHGLTRPEPSSTHTDVTPELRGVAIALRPTTTKVCTAVFEYLCKPCIPNRGGGGGWMAVTARHGAIHHVD